MDSADLEFNEWARRWMELAKFQGRRLLDEERRIAVLLSLWDEPIPGNWKRGRDPRLVDPDRRYCRGNDAEEIERGWTPGPALSKKRSRAVTF